jgi:hypothetical protein
MIGKARCAGFAGLCSFEKPSLCLLSLSLYILECPEFIIKKSELGGKFSVNCSALGTRRL